MMECNVAAITRQDAERLVEAGLPAADVVRFLVGRTGLMQPQSMHEFEFVHRTFQEFLAAGQIVADNRVVKAVQDFASQPEWHETLCLIAAYATPGDQERLLEELYSLAETLDGEEARRLHLLAWEFWELLDIRTHRANEWIARHADRLSDTARSLDLRYTQVSDLSPLTGLSSLQSLNLSEHTGQRPVAAERAE